MNRNRTRKLTTGMIRIILLCWVIPYLVISSALIQTYSRRNRRQISDTVCSAMDNAGRIITEKIVSVIEDSRQASYDGVIKKSYEQFLKDENERQIESFLERHGEFEIAVLPDTIPERIRAAYKTGVQLLPGVNASGGFYICRMRRKRL